MIKPLHTRWFQLCYYLYTDTEDIRQKYYYSLLTGKYISRDYQVNVLRHQELVKKLNDNV